MDKLLIIEYIDCPGGREIALRCIVGPLEIVGVVDEFGNDEIEVIIALPVPLGWQVHRYAIHRSCEVGAMVEVKAAQQKLVRFACAAVLRDDQSRNKFLHLARPQNRAIFKELAGIGPAAGGACCPYFILVMLPEHIHLFQFDYGLGTVVMRHLCGIKRIIIIIYDCGESAVFMGKGAH